jgi:hypothetical protein
MADDTIRATLERHTRFITRTSCGSSRKDMNHATRPEASGEGHRGGGVMIGQPSRRRCLRRTWERLRQRPPRPSAFVRALQQIYADAREDPTLAAVRQRLGR